MGKKGPCFHCGIEWTPLWRNGPAHKPVLCNACGSRWRIWGNLENYIPKHGMGGPNCKDTQRSQQSKLPIPFEARKLRKPKRRSHGFEQDTKKGTRSGSAITSSHNCIHCDSKTGKEESGSVKPSFWDTQIPRRKRSVLTQYILTQVGWLHRQLRYILQEQEFSKLPREQEEVLISQNGQMRSAEIGLGCVQLKSPGSPEEENSESPGSPQEENSESSSFTPENETSGLYASP